MRNKVLQSAFTLSATLLAGCGSAPAYNVYLEAFDGDRVPYDWTYFQEYSPRKLAYNNPASASVSDGTLKITARKNDSGAIELAMLESNRDFLYGRFETRMKFPTQYGLQPAFWLTSPEYLLGDDDVKLYGAEIDIMEHITRVPGKVQSVVYYNGYGENIKRSHVSVTPLSDGGWHTYALDWTPDKYAFYVDGVLVSEITEGVSQTPERINISMEISKWSACGGTLRTPGWKYKPSPDEALVYATATCDGEALPDPTGAVLEVDYVKVSELPQG